jgi:hypothetical protein
MISELFSGLAGLGLGALLGHWLALGRDYRKEFNRAAAPLQETLLRAEKAAVDYSGSIGWDEKELYSVKVILSDRKRHKLDRLLENYRQAWEEAHYQEKSSGAIVPIQEKYPSLVKAIRELRQFLKLK